MAPQMFVFTGKNHLLNEHIGESSLDEETGSWSWILFVVPWYLNYTNLDGETVLYEGKWMRLEFTRLCNTHVLRGSHYSKLSDLIDVKYDGITVICLL